MPKELLFDVDTEYGHVVDASALGPVYRDDGSFVDYANLRPCFGCKVKIERFGHDPCIAQLPGTLQACCGHGLDKSPRTGMPAGYAAFRDGRTIRFSGCEGGPRIRQVVEGVLAGQPLPEGFEFDADRAWWDGLSETQCHYVRERIAPGLVRLVTAVRNGQPVSERFLSGEAMWWDGLTAEEKQTVLGQMPGLLAELVAEALEQPAVAAQQPALAADRATPAVGES